MRHLLQWLEALGKDHSLNPDIRGFPFAAPTGQVTSVPNSRLRRLLLLVSVNKVYWVCMHYCLPGILKLIYQFYVTTNWEVDHRKILRAYCKVQSSK